MSFIETVVVKINEFLGMLLHMGSSASSELGGSLGLF